MILLKMLWKAKCRKYRYTNGNCRVRPPCQHCFGFWIWIHLDKASQKGIAMHLMGLIGLTENHLLRAVPLLPNSYIVTRQKLLELGLEALMYPPYKWHQVINNCSCLWRMVLKKRLCQRPEFQLKWHYDVVFKW